MHEEEPKLRRIEQASGDLDPARASLGDANSIIVRAVSDEPPERSGRPSSRAAGVGWGLAAIAAGVFFGLGLFTFAYGDGAAYLQDDPSGCANCHVMQEHHDAWQKSSHARVATCNDCHLRHDFLGKWLTKADNGFFHSLAFTTGAFPDPIRIKPRNRRVAQDACLGCHAQHVYAVLPAVEGDEALLCAHCHGDVGHAQR